MSDAALQTDEGAAKPVEQSVRMDIISLDSKAKSVSNDPKDPKNGDDGSWSRLSKDDSLTSYEEFSCDADYQPQEVIVQEQRPLREWEIVADEWDDVSSTMSHETVDFSTASGSIAGSKEKVMPEAKCPRTITTFEDSLPPLQETINEPEPPLLELCKAMNDDNIAAHAEEGTSTPRDKCIIDGQDLPPFTKCASTIQSARTIKKMGISTKEVCTLVPTSSTSSLNKIKGQELNSLKTSASTTDTAGLPKTGGILGHDQYALPPFDSSSSPSSDKMNGTEPPLLSTNESAGKVAKNCNGPTRDQGIVSSVNQSSAPLVETTAALTGGDKKSLTASSWHGDMKCLVQQARLTYASDFAGYAVCLPEKGTYQSVPQMLAAAASSPEVASHPHTPEAAADTSGSVSLQTFHTTADTDSMVVFCPPRAAAVRKDETECVFLPRACRFLKDLVKKIGLNDVAAFEVKKE